MLRDGPLQWLHHHLSERWIDLSNMCLCGV